MDSTARTNTQVNGAVANALQAEIDALRDALDHIARVALGSRKATKRTRWIVERAKSALNRDDLWKQAETPKGYHDALVKMAECRICGKRDCDDDCEELQAIYREHQREKLRDIDIDEITCDVCGMTYGQESHDLCRE